MSPWRWTLLVLLLLLGLVLALFVVQNSARTTDLSLDLFFWAAHLQRPLPVPWLLLSTFAGGLLLGVGWGLLGRYRLGRRVEDLELELARKSLRSPASTGPRSVDSPRPVDDDPWT